MVRITEELIRKKSEHNELMIGTLEEISLHQEDIEKIEHFHNWCKDLKILLLQNNLISKIENLFKLKKLEYLNLALNNIELIENLEKLESLNKLDLTLNFIGELTSVENLSDNFHLRYLTLTGNPCTDYKGYRNYVIAILPQLDTLDGEEIKISDKILAKQEYEKNRPNIIQSQAKYRIQRDEQKIRLLQEKELFDEKISQCNDDDEKRKLFWESKSEHCPETRYAISKEHRKGRGLDEEKKPKQKIKEINFFAPCGRPYNMNQAKLKFFLKDEPDHYELDLHVYKFMDTSFINVDVQPHYVRVKVKNKYLQLALADEVKCIESASKRSQVTGKLLITMPKLNLNEHLVFRGHHIETSRGTEKKSDSEFKGTVDIKSIIKNKNIIKDLGVPDLI